MKQPIDMGFAERRKASAEAKSQLLNKLKPKLDPETPEAIARRAEREALAKARDVRTAERQRLKREQEEREKVEAAARAEAEAIAAAAAKEEEARRETAEAAERKAERDRRYAARKLRQR